MAVAQALALTTSAINEKQGQPSQPEFEIDAQAVTRAQ
jgi:hypothetical protein